MMRLKIIASGDWAESPHTALSLPLSLNLPLIQVERLTAAALTPEPGATLTLIIEDQELIRLRIDDAQRLNWKDVAKFVRRYVEATRRT